MVCVIFSNSGKIKDAKLILPNSIFRTPINTISYKYRLVIM